MWTADKYQSITSRSTECRPLKVILSSEISQLRPHLGNNAGHMLHAMRGYCAFGIAPHSGIEPFRHDITFGMRKMSFTRACQQLYSIFRMTSLIHGYKCLSLLFTSEWILHLAPQSKEASASQERMQKPEPTFPLLCLCNIQ
jgi:hypothetical protein